MGAVFDIFIYTFFAWVMCRLAQISAKSKKKIGKFDQGVILFIIFFSIIAGIRWGVGTDCNTYIENFRFGLTSEKDASEKEIIWNALVKFVYNMGFHFSIGMGIVACLQISFITKALIKYKYILIMLPIVIFGGRYFVAMMNAMRQFVAACIFLFAAKYIVNKNLVKYVICIGIASCIHHSALMLLPCYFIPQSFSICNINRYILVSIYLICLGVGMTPQFQSLASYIELVATYAGYGDGYSNHIVDSLTIGDDSEAQSLGPINISFIIIALLLIWFMPRIWEKYGKMIPELRIWYFFSFVYGCSFILLHNAGHMMVRPFQYLLPFEMVVLSLLLFYLKQGYKYHPIKDAKDSLFSSPVDRNSVKHRGVRNLHRLPSARSIYLFAVLVIWICTIWSVIKAQGNPDEVATYKLFFFHV